MICVKLGDMKASEISLGTALDGVRQYHVPLFQRSYTWRERNWSELWNDVLETVQSPHKRKHFFGAVVSKSENVPQSSVTRYLLIDGQQRLTTVFLLLCALRDEARARGQNEWADDIEQELLFNHRKKGEDYWKLWPTGDDRAAFESVMRGKSADLNAKGNAVSGTHPLAIATLYFRRRLGKRDAPPLEQLKEALLERFEIVAVLLGTDDDPYRIFESLNAKGERLTEADLIRNYFLMRVPSEQQAPIYAQLWQPMQSALGDKLSDFVRHFLSKDGELISKGDVYYTVREKVQTLRTPGEVEAYLQEIARFAAVYARFLEPKREPDAAIRASLDRLRRIQMSVCYPFLLHLFVAREAGTLSTQIVRDVLETLESYAIRRWVCLVPTFGLNNYFPSLWRDAREAVGGDLKRLNEGVRHVLSSKKAPDDASFENNFMASQMYGGGERLAKVHVILERLEQAFDHKEEVDLTQLSVEHLMPQTLTPQWQEELGSKWKEDHENLLHTIGNLTLTAYNSELSNAEWPHKRRELTASHLELNREVAREKQWRAPQIEARSQELARRAIAIWPTLGSASTGASRGQGVKFMVPTQITILDETQSVDSWREVAQITLEMVAQLSPDAFEEVAQTYPARLSASGAGMRSPRRMQNGWSLETNLDANALYQLAERAARRAELGVDEWRVEYQPA